MKHTILMSLVAVAAAFGCSPPQPLMNCNVAHGLFAVNYTRTAGTPATGSLCDLGTDVVSMQKYSTDDGQFLYIQPVQAGVEDHLALMAPPIGGAGLAKGTMSDKQPVDGICDIDGWENATAVKTLTRTPAAYGGGNTLRHTYSNMKFRVAPANPGTIVEFNVDVAVEGPGACSASYSAVGMFPVVACGDGDVDDNGVSDPDQSACGHYDQWYTFLALNPAFDVECRPSPGYGLYGSLFYFGAGGFENYIGMDRICAPRDPANLFCPEGGCSWQQDEEG